MSTGIQDVFFDDKATYAMGVAFDHACSLLWHRDGASEVRERIAKRIIEAAKSGERDPVRLRSHALMACGIDESVHPIVGIAGNFPRPDPCSGGSKDVIIVGPVAPLPDVLEF